MTAQPGSCDSMRDIATAVSGEGRRESTDPKMFKPTARGGAGGSGQREVVLSRKDRLQVFGIDCTGPCGDGILFKGGEWVPGGEYTQRLRVKNVSPKLKKLKYRLPTTKFFSLAYPEVITLSPGTVQEVDVVFRPMSSEVYDDVVLFKVLDGPNAGGFNVPVRALLPMLQVSIPTGLDFGYCQAEDTSERIVRVQNTGQQTHIGGTTMMWIWSTSDLVINVDAVDFCCRTSKNTRYHRVYLDSEVPAPFRWEVPPPFRISPLSGIVPVGEAKLVTCSIRPMDASVVVSQAVVRVGEGVNAIKPHPILEMKVSAVGKYCYVVPSEDELDFGHQTIIAGGGSSRGSEGCPSRKDFTLKNQSPVPAAFAIHRLEDDFDTAFAVHPSEGVIPPEAEVVVTATYTPVSAGMFSRDHYEIVTVGGNKVTVGIQGRAVGCVVRLEKKEDPFARGCGVPDSVNFREVKVGMTTSRVVYLYNESCISCRFFFAVQGNSSVFRFSRTRGLIPSAGSENPGETQVTLTFSPVHPTNYYRRIFCLLENQHPLVMDVMGTGFIAARREIQEQRPAPLRHAHVQAFRNRENVGLGRCSAEELDSLLSAEGMSDLFAKVGPQGTLPLQRSTISRPLTRSGEATRVQAAVAAEYFIDPADPQLNTVFLDRVSINFGFAAGGGEETANLTNNSNAEVHVVWNVRPSSREEGKLNGSGLRITPVEAEVPAGGSFAFRIGLFPTKGNCYFTEEAEAFISPSNQTTFRCVKDPLQQPPWFVSVRVMGHTFVGEQFLAKASLSTQYTGQRVCFPACHVGDTVYQTLRLSNQGNIPACFSFQLDHTGVFDIKPSLGLVPAGDFQLCLMRFTPSAPGRCRFLLTCVLNNETGSTLEAELFGQGAVPAIEAVCGEVDERGRALLPLSGQASEEELENDGVVSVYLRPTCVGIVSSDTVQVRNTSRLPVIFTIEPPKTSSGVLRISPLAGILLGNQTQTIQVVFAPRKTKRYRFRLPVKVRSLLGDTPRLTDCRQLGEAKPAVVESGTEVNIVGQGRRGAVAFHPPSIEYSVRLVNTPESKVLVLENCSECDVRYKLFYIVNKEPPGRLPPSGGAEKRAKSRGLKAVPQENGEAKAQGGTRSSDAFFVNVPQGVLRARSRTRTIATFRPVSEGEHDFSILCQISPNNSSGQGGISSCLKFDMANTGHEARASAAMLHESVAGSLVGANSAADELEEESGILPLRCGVSGRASFPTIVFRDVRMTRAGGGDVQGASPRNLWSALSLSTINDMLRKPLTEEEVRFNQESSPDASQLPRFSIPFVPAVIGSGAVLITLQVFNPGFLETAVTVNLPNVKTVEMETWANEGEPTAEELRQSDIIDRLKVFTLTPNSGVRSDIAGGQGRLLRITYSADSLSYGGVHDLPILVKINEGRQFWLDLKGTTLPRQSPMLYVPTGLQRHYQLEPVAVGTPLTEAPLQITEVLNVGETAVSYRIDDYAFERTNSSQGHGIPVFRLEEANGVIMGGRSASLRWRFLPLEAKEYVLRVTIRAVENHEERFGIHPEPQLLAITVKGIGYDPRTRNPHSEELPSIDLGVSHPARQLEVLPEQTCVLGVERLRIGRIPQGAVLSRVIFIRNCLTSTALSFSWDPRDSGVENTLFSSGVATIRPLKGVLEAEQSMLCLLQISAECGPSFLCQRPLACAVRPVPLNTATRSRRPKSRLERSREEEKIARAKPPEPRIPVVSRPTAARSSHMVEVAHLLSSRAIKDDTGRLMTPHYPVSTHNPLVPRVLAEALEGRGNGGLVHGKCQSLADSLGQTDHQDHLEPRRSTTSGVASLLWIEVEGEVVCSETYRRLYGQRGESRGRLSRPDRDHANPARRDGNGGETGDVSTRYVICQTERADSFCIPCPSSHVPDWAALSAADKPMAAQVTPESDSHDGVASVQSVSEDKKDEKSPVNALMSVARDPVLTNVISRVLTRLMGDVVATHGVRQCLSSLPSTPRVPTVREIQRIASLPDRMVVVLAPHLQRYLACRSARPISTPAAAAVHVSAGGGTGRVDVCPTTSFSKEELRAAFEEVEEPVSEGVDSNDIQNRQIMTKQPRAGSLARVFTVLEAYSSPSVTLLELVAALDHKTLSSIERWLEQSKLRAQSARRGSVTDATCAGDVTEQAQVVEPGVRGTDAPDTSQESMAALTIQSQARRRQALQTSKEAVQKRLQLLVDEACQRPETQRTVATALEGTFFNLIQEAFYGEFDLSKRPKRFAVRKPSIKLTGSTGGFLPKFAPAVQL